MDFTAFKINIIEVSGLAKDALHIYVGVGVYLLCLLVLRPIIKNQSIRSFMALVVVTGIALLGEYLDNRNTIEASGMARLKPRTAGRKPPRFDQYLPAALCTLCLE